MKRLERMAAEGNPAVQLVLPLAETLGWLRRGVGELIRQACLQLMELMMEEEARALVGDRSRPSADRQLKPLGHGAGLLRGHGAESAGGAAASPERTRR